MPGLFEGQPKTATSYVTSSSEMPRWMQDAVYNQIQVATNLANKPYEEYTLSGERGVAQLTPLQQAAYSKAASNAGVGFTYDAQGNVTGTQFGTPAHMATLGSATTGMGGFGTKGTAADLRAAQNQYLTQPLINKAETTTAQSLAERALTAANPYLQSAGQTAASQVGQYMSPYQQGVLDVIAKQGARNLSENLLPQVSDAFVKAGQFGSSRMGEFGSRAMRDTQEAILNQQAQAAQQGYGQSLQAAQADLARQAQLAGTVGSISGADLSRILQGGAQYGNLGQAQQQFGLTAAQQAQQAQAQDYARQMQAYQNMAGMAQQQQQMGFADTAALESAGLAQQRQGQRNLDAERAEYEAQQLYPRQQMDWLSTQIRGMQPVTPQAQTSTRSSTGEVYAPSPLSTLATGLYTGRGLGVI